jgi:hypothetical protein
LRWTKRRSRRGPSCSVFLFFAETLEVLPVRSSSKVIHRWRCSAKSDIAVFRVRVIVSLFVVLLLGMFVDRTFVVSLTDEIVGSSLCKKDVAQIKNCLVVCEK